MVEGVRSIGQMLGLATVAVQPVYCRSPEEKPRLRLLAAIDGNCALAEVPPQALPDGGDPDVAVHCLTPREVAERFVDSPAAVDRAGQVAARCGPALPDGRPIWPAIALPEGQSADQALAEVARAGLEERYGPRPGAEARDRLDRELAAIASYGYAPLFLVVADVARFAR